VVDMVKKVHKKGAQFLQPEEQVLGATVVNGVGQFKKSVAFGAIGGVVGMAVGQAMKGKSEAPDEGTMAESLPVTKQAILAVSNQRWILFEQSAMSGAPKGVVLSHKNLMGNVKQISDVLDVEKEDIIMGSLPQFHAFGLTVAGLLPLLEGIPVVFHPDPTDVLNIAKAVSNHKITIMCGTSTRLRLYARNRKVLPLMLDSLRLVVAGAERLSAVVRDMSVN